MTSFAEVLRSPGLRRAGLCALILCTACLAVENTLLLSWAAATRPWSVLVVAAAAFRMICALSVPLGLLLLTAIAGWCLPSIGAHDARTRRQPIVSGGRHER